MSRKHQFMGSLIKIIEHNKDGSYRTQNDRRVLLMHMMKNLYQKGYQLEHVKFIKQKHIEYLVDAWQKDDISTGTLKNRTSHLKWLMEKLNKPNLVPDNNELNIPKRVYSVNQDKSRDLPEEKLNQIQDPYMRLNLRAQQFFGLRMEESLKIKPHLADQGNQLYLQGSWTKGGRERYISILTPEQRIWINEAKALVQYQNNSLIPTETNYKSYRERFKKRCQRVDINKRHGLRHDYAQKRYQELTGFPCPAKGGLSKHQMTQEQKY